MKKIQYLLIALLCGSMTACMDDEWKEPEATTAEVYGNLAIRQSNLITIKELKTRYSTCFVTDSVFAEVKEPLQIKGFVTANDIQGNMYQQITIQDATSAITIGIAQGGVCGYLPEGTEILVELNGLFIGNYRQNPTIGVPYTDKNGNTYVSRMSRHLWQQHFTYTGKKEVLKPDTFAIGTKKTKWDIDMDQARLGVLVGVSFKSGQYYDATTGNRYNLDFNDESTFAVTDFTTSWYFNEQSSASEGGVILYNSSYADFAAAKLPHGKVDVTGAFIRYRGQWEIIIRSKDDIVPSQYDGSLDVTIAPTGNGTEASPFNVAAALEKCIETGATATSQDYYATGYVISSPGIDTNYGNATFKISDTLDGDNELTVYRAKGPGNKSITSESLFKKGDKVTVYGKLVNFGGNTPEFTQGCYITAIQ